MATKTGRPSILTQAMIDDLRSVIKEGNYVSVACGICGIDERIIYKWLDRGEKEPGTLFSTLSQSVKKAQAEAERLHLTRITTAGERNWQASAWFLERTKPDRYSRRDRIEAHVKIGPAIDFEIETLSQPHTGQLEEGREEMPTGPR